MHSQETRKERPSTPLEFYHKIRVDMMCEVGKETDITLFLKIIEVLGMLRDGPRMAWQLLLELEILSCKPTSRVRMQKRHIDKHHDWDGFTEDQHAPYDLEEPDQVFEEQSREWCIGQLDEAMYWAMTDVLRAEGEDSISRRDLLYLEAAARRKSCEGLGFFLQCTIEALKNSGYRAVVDQVNAKELIRQNRDRIRRTLAKQQVAQLWIVELLVTEGSRLDSILPEEWRLGSKFWRDLEIRSWIFNKYGR